MSADAPRSPFKGLSAFEDTHVDALLFFGRARERDVIVANLLASRLTVLYGASGVGKSSVLRAGVARELRRVAPEARVAIHDTWSGDASLGLGELAGGAEAYLILDQFEEYFVYHGSADGPGSLLHELPELVRAGNVHVLISLREDALARLDAFKAVLPGIFGNQLRLDHLDRDAGRAAIVGPVGRWNELAGEQVDVEEELVESVLDEVAAGKVDLVGAGAGAVDQPVHEELIEAPYLQLVLERIWEAERAGGSATLRRETLRELGGAEAIVRDHVDSALDQLDGGGKDVAASMFDHLVTPSGTKVAHRAGDLAQYAAVPEDALRGVLSTLNRERILRAVDGAGAGGERYEIFHDVLAEPVLAWRSRRQLERERDQAARRHRRLLAVTAASLVALAAVAAVAVFALTQRSSARAEARRAHARELDANALADLGTDPQGALRSALSAALLSPSGQAEDVLRTSLLAARLRALLPAGGPVTSALYSKDGRRLVTASTDGKARIYDASDNRLLRTLDAHSPLAGAVFDPSGRYLVTEGRDGAARFWDVQSGTVRHVFRHRGAVLSAAFTQGGGLLVTTGVDRTARIWHVPSGKPVRTIRHPGPVRGAVFTRDGGEVVTRSTDRFARLYDTKKGKLLRTFDQGGTVTAALFSPRGTFLVTGGANRTARVWDPATGRLLRELKGHTGQVLGAAFPPNGRLLATVSTDGSARVWAFPSGELLTVLLGHSNYVTSAAFSPDNFSLVTTSVDRTARVWQPGTGDLRAVLAGHTESVTSASFRRDGKAVVTASEDGTARVWDPQIQPELRAVVRAPGPLLGASYSADGSRFLVVGPGGSASARVATTGRPLNALTSPAKVAAAVFGPGGRTALAAGNAVLVDDGRRLVAPAAVDSVAFGADGRIAAGSADGNVRIWAGRELLRVIRAGRHGATSVSFSPDGRRVATATADGVARVWDASSGKLELTLRGHRDALTAARFSPDGSQLVTASFDHDARIWDARTGTLLHVLRGHFAVVSDAEFSPDGRWVVTAGPTTAGLWDVRTGALVFFLRGHTGRLTSATFDPSSRRILTASIDGTARTYVCDVCGGLDDLVTLARRRLRQAR